MGSTPNSGYEVCYLDGRQSVAGMPPVHIPMSDPLIPSAPSNESPWLVWGRSAFALAVVAILLALGVANIVTRARWHEVEDGVLWAARPRASPRWKWRAGLRPMRRASVAAI